MLGRELLFRTNDLSAHAHRADGNNGVLVYTFTERGNIHLDDDGFGTRFLIDRGFDVIAVKSAKWLWYENLTTSLVETLKEASYRRSYGAVSTYGSSMGGYAALRFAKDLNAHNAFALSPVMTIKKKWDRRWASDAQHLNPDVDMFPESAVSSNVTYMALYDNLSLDRLQVEALKTLLGTSLRAVRVPLAGHPVGPLLRFYGELERIAVAALSGGGLPPFVRRDKEQRRRSETYLFELARSLLRGDRLSASKAAIEAALRLNCDNPEYHMVLAKILHKEGDLEKAISAASRSADLNPRNPNFAGYRDLMLKEQLAVASTRTVRTDHEADVVPGPHPDVARTRLGDVAVERAPHTSKASPSLLMHPACDIPTAVTKLGPAAMLMTTKCVPIHYWDLVPNFGDLLAPWLVTHMTGLPTVLVKDQAALLQPHYVLVGSILGHVSDGSTVWGTGSFGTETSANLKADYRAVRGPLTRNRIRTLKGECPPVYGDPGLLCPVFYTPSVERKHEVGIIIRHSEASWRKALAGQNVLLIDLKTDKIEETIDAICSCKRIVSSSLHGLILADAYGIPNAWLDSDTPMGLNFKYWDYLISVDKVRNPQNFDFTRGGLTAQDVIDAFHFDDRSLAIDIDALMDANPFGWVPDEKARAALPLRKND